MKTYNAGGYPQQTGGAVCAPCAVPLLFTPVGAAAVGVGACAYGAKKGYDYYKKKKKTKKKSKSKKKSKKS